MMPRAATLNGLAFCRRFSYGFVPKYFKPRHKGVKKTYPKRSLDMIQVYVPYLRMGGCITLGGEVVNRHVGLNGLN